MRLETRYKRNILKTWREVSHEDVKAGVEWYPVAQEIAREVGQGDVRLGAGVIAAFSPMMKWSLNVELARNAILNRTFIGHFNANNLKAQRIFEGEDPRSVLGGKKVRAFYEQIVSGGEGEVPVIDRHSIAVALNRNASDAERSVYARPKRYDALAQAYIEVAGELGIPVGQLQAITWVNWRRRKGMVD